MHPHFNGPRSRVLAVVVIASLLVGCSSWRPRPLADPSAAAAASIHYPGRSRVTLKSGERVEVFELTVASDSLRATRAGTGAPLVVAAADVARVEIRQHNTLKSILFGVGGLVVLGAVLVTIAAIELAKSD